MMHALSNRLVYVSVRRFRFRSFRSPFCAFRVFRKLEKLRICCVSRDSNAQTLRRLEVMLLLSKQCVHVYQLSRLTFARTLFRDFVQFRLYSYNIVYLAHQNHKQPQNTIFELNFASYFHVKRKKNYVFIYKFFYL